MSLIAQATSLIERAPLPDAVSKLGVAFLVGRTSRKLAGTRADIGEFARAMARRPIAEHVADANAQHYELPASFFGHCLGPQRKYSCCLYDGEATTLTEAEERALAETASHAGLADGQSILELGCGWGSLTLWMARRFPGSRVVAVSNSHAQRAHIQDQAIRHGLGNIAVVTADMNTFAPGACFDRIVSVEMFEHMANWRALLSRLHDWLNPGGRLFIHVFSHRSAPYAFDHTDEADWIARHFFTGGVMPSHDLIHAFGDLFAVEREWRWNGTHYARTLLDWLARFDAGQEEIMPILRETYGDAAALWQRRWRLFFLASAGMFGHGGGSEWGVSHYRLAPT